jgi:hypothetical protein
MTLISQYQQMTITGGSVTIYGRRSATVSATELDLLTRLGETPWRGAAGGIGGGERYEIVDIPTVRPPAAVIVSRCLPPGLRQTQQASDPLASGSTRLIWRTPSRLRAEVTRTQRLTSRPVFFVGVAFVAAVVLLIFDQGFGQDKHKVSWIVKAENSKLTVRQNLEHPDLPGHTLGVVEFRRTWPDGGGPVVQGQKVIEEIARGFYDAVAGNGDGSGYSVWSFENGDLMFGQWRNTLQSVISADRSRKTTYVGTYLTTGGTGKFKRIKGVGRYSGLGEFDSEGKPTRNEYSAEGEYWSEK